MTTKSLLLVGAFALATLPLASAKTYTISLFQPATAGNVSLKAGDYLLKVKGTTAVFTERHPSPSTEYAPPTYGKSFTVPVNVETAAHKFGKTAVVVLGDKNSGTAQIQKIDLGGSRSELRFNN